MGPLGGHLGTKVSALLDGQLPAEEAERAWAHVHSCHTCRDLVEREGWVKTRLLGLSLGDCGGAPDRLKGALRGGPDGVTGLSGATGVPPGDVYLALAAEREHRGKRTAGLVALGGGAVGAAVLGVLALGAAPADAPHVDRRAPVTHIGTPPASPTPGPPTLRRP